MKKSKSKNCQVGVQDEKGEATCEWSCDGKKDTAYDTQCGHSIEKPDNSDGIFKFCPFCGDKIKFDIAEPVKWEAK
jgi:membrane protease subunit (stomatin/prohibitin family)